MTIQIQQEAQNLMKTRNIQSHQKELFDDIETMKKQLSENQQRIQQIRELTREESQIQTEKPKNGTIVLDQNDLEIIDKVEKRLKEIDLEME